MLGTNQAFLAPGNASENVGRVLGTDCERRVSDNWSATVRDAVQADDRRKARRALADLPEHANDEVIEQVARLASTGSLLAVELLVQLLDSRGTARRAVRGFVVDQAAVDDVTQDVLITVAEKVGDFRGEAQFTTWLHQVARYRSIDYLRRQRDTLPLDQDAQPDPADSQPANQSPAVRMSSVVASDDAVRQLLERLPDPYRETVRLRDIDRLTYVEVADVLGRNLNTVKSHVARGRAILAAVIEAERTT